MTEPCPDPKRECPMTTPAFIARLEKIEAEIRHAKEARHAFNAHVARVIQTETSERVDLEESVNILTGKIESLVDTFQGRYGRQGVSAEMQSHEQRLNTIERILSEQSSYQKGAWKIIMAMGAVAGVIGTVIAFAVQIFFEYIHK